MSNKKRKQKLNDSDRIAQLEHWLAECYKLTGADSDGDEDWRLAPKAVEEVRRFRQEFDELQDEVVQLEGELEDAKLGS